jgi:hypothetical protein
LGRYTGRVLERPGTLGWADSEVKPGWTDSTGPREKI